MFDVLLLFLRINKGEVLHDFHAKCMKVWPYKANNKLPPWTQIQKAQVHIP